MSRAMVDSIIALPEVNRFSKGIFAWVGYETKWVEFENVERSAGETKWSFWKLFRYSIEGIVSFSNTPIHMASYMGIGLTGLSALALIFVVRPSPIPQALTLLFTFLGITTFPSAINLTSLLISTFSSLIINSLST